MSPGTEGLSGCFSPDPLKHKPVPCMAAPCAPAGGAYSCWPGFRELSSTMRSYSSRNSSSSPASPKAPHSVLTHMRPSSPSTSSTLCISSM